LKRVEKMKTENSVLISDSTASALLDISRATCRRRVADGTFPQPIRIGGVSRWRRDALMEALECLSGNGEAV